MMAKKKISREATGRTWAPAGLLPAGHTKLSLSLQGGAIRMVIGSNIIRKWAGYAPTICWSQSPALQDAFVDGSRRAPI